MNCWIELWIMNLTKLRWCLCIVAISYFFQPFLLAKFVTLFWLFVVPVPVLLLVLIRRITVVFWVQWDICITFIVNLQGRSRSITYGMDCRKGHWILSTFLCYRTLVIASVIFKWNMLTLTLTFIRFMYDMFIILLSW